MCFKPVKEKCISFDVSIPAVPPRHLYELYFSAGFLQSLCSLSHHFGWDQFVLIFFRRTVTIRIICYFHAICCADLQTPQPDVDLFRSIVEVVEQNLRPILARVQTQERNVSRRLLERKRGTLQSALEVLAEQRMQ